MKLFAVLFALWAPIVLADVATVQATPGYVGLSSDTKPTQGVKAGTTFYESDTMATYVCVSAESDKCESWADSQTIVALLAGEDETNSVMRIEGQFSYCLDDADLVCKATPGFLHTVSCWGEDAAATAGRVQIRDSATATGGTVVWQQEYAAAIAPPVNAVLDIVMAAGVAIDWDTTADVFCTVTYR